MQLVAILVFFEILFFDLLINNKQILYINSILILFSFIPTISLWGISGHVKWNMIGISTLYWTVLEGALVIAQNYLKSYNNSRLNKTIPKLRLLPLFLVFTVAVALYMVYRYAGGFRVIVFSSSLAARLATREIHIPAFFRYFYTIMGGAILPMISAYAFKMRQYWMVILSIICSYLFYSINGMKSWILFQLIIVLFFIIFNKNTFDIDRVIMIITFGGNMLWGLGAYIFYSYNNISLVAYMHRAFTILADISYYNFDFFSNNELLLLRDSIGRFFSKSPYPYIGSMMIGRTYYYSSTMNATDGLMADAFSNFGVVGIIIFPILLSITLSYMAYLLEGYESYFSYSVIFIVVYQFIGNSFFTTLISGGYIFIVLILKLIDRQSPESKKSKIILKFK